MAKDQQLEKSQAILQQKDQELKKMRGIAQYTPEDVERIAGDNDPIEILKEIAVDNQLSQNPHSPEKINQQSNKAILNHPFYQNLSTQKKANLESMNEK